MRNLASLLFLSLCLLARPSRAAVYDVGSNTTYASFSAAFVSMTADASGLGANETLTVQVNAGTYHESVQVPLLPNPIQIIAVAGATPNIISSASYGIYVSGVAHVLIQGLQVSGANLAGIYLQSAPQAVLAFNSLHNNGGGEILVKDSPLAWISDNSLHAANAGLLLQNSPGSTVRYNQVSSYSGGDYSSGITFDSCTFSAMSNNQVFSADSSLQVFNSSNVSLTANAAISASGNTGLYIDNSPGLIARVNLLSGQNIGVELDSSSHTVLQNNTIWNHVAVGLRLANSPQLELRNNLLQGLTCIDSDSASFSGLFSNNNDLVSSDHIAVVGTSAYSTLGLWQGTGQDLNSLSLDPVFANASGSAPASFMLQSGSPVLGQGVNLSASFTLDYFQNVEGPWDPGFHDASSILPATPTPTATPSPVLPTPTPTPSFTASPTPTVTPSPTISPTALTTPGPSFTATPTASPTPYPIKKNKLVSYPNPFNPALGSLSFVFDPADNASIKVFDVANTAVADVSSILGSHGYASWDGRGNNGQALPAGLYFAVLRSSQGNHFTKLTIVH